MKAAAALSDSRGNDLVRVETKLDKLDEKALKAASTLTKLETSVSLLIWMVGVSIMLSVVLLGKAVLH